MTVVPPCVWCGPVYEPTGYADEARGMLVALEDAGVPITLRPTGGGSAHQQAFTTSLTDRDRRILAAQESRAITSPYVLVQHYLAEGFVRAPHADYLVGRTMFETDSLPPHWVTECNRMDELWLPSEFNRNTFVRAGVRVPIYLVPGGIDAEQFAPSVSPMPLAGARGTVFLAIFEWRQRKGWDVLLRAWAEAFAADDDVTLVLRSNRPRASNVSDALSLSHGSTRSNASPLVPAGERDIYARMTAFLRESCGECAVGRRTLDNVAPIIVLDDALPVRAMPTLYAAAHAFVSPTRGEGWGRPFMEAMASALPVIATRWGAHLTFMNDTNSLLLHSDGVVPAWDPEIHAYAGQGWASPNVGHLIEQLQFVHRNRAAAQAVGVRARQDMVEHWPWQRSAVAIRERLLDIGEQRVRPTTACKQSVPSSAATADPTTSLTTRLFLDTRLFCSTANEPGVESLFVALRDQLRDRLVIPSVSDTEARPSHGLPIARLWDAQRQVKANQPALPGQVDVTLTWLQANAPGTEPIVGRATDHAINIDCSKHSDRLNDTHRDAQNDHTMQSDHVPHSDIAVPPSAGRWIVATHNTVRDTVPAALVPLLRDRADEVWVPTHAAYDACVSVGIARDKLWRAPFGSIAGECSPDAARNWFGDRGDGLLLMPVTDTFDIAEAELVLRIWQRVAADRTRPSTIGDSDASSAPQLLNLRLHVLLPNGATGALANFGDRLHERVYARQKSAGLSITVSYGDLTDASLAASVRAADVVIALGAASIALWHVALATGRPLIARASVDANEVLIHAGAWLIPVGTHGMMSGAPLSAALTAACDATVRTTRSQLARVHAESLPPWSDVAAKMIMRSFNNPTGTRNAAPEQAPTQLPSNLSMRTPRLWFAMLTYNALDYTKRCLASLDRHTVEPWRAVILDNTSTDGTRDWLGQLGDDRIEIEFGATNRGVAGGRNRLLELMLDRVPDDGFLIFIDNDLEFPAHWTEPFLSFFDSNPNAGMASGSGHEIVVHDMRRELLSVPTHCSMRVDVAAGGFACFVRPAVFHQIGRYDEELNPFWHEDDDISVRAAAAGWGVYSVPTAGIIHHGHKSGAALPGLALGGSLDKQRYLVQKWRTQGLVAPDGRLQFQHPDCDAAHPDYATALGVLLQRSGPIRRSEYERGHLDAVLLQQAMSQHGSLASVARYVSAPAFATLRVGTHDEAQRTLSEQIAETLAQRRRATRLPEPGQTAVPALNTLADAQHWDRDTWFAHARDTIQDGRGRHQWYDRSLVTWRNTQAAYAIAQLQLDNPNARLLLVTDLRSPLVWGLAQSVGEIVVADLFERYAEHNSGHANAVWLAAPERYASRPTDVRRVRAVAMAHMHSALSAASFDAAVVLPWHDDMRVEEIGALLTAVTPLVRPNGPLLTCVRTRLAGPPVPGVLESPMAVSRWTQSLGLRMIDATATQDTDMQQNAMRNLGAVTEIGLSNIGLLAATDRSSTSRRAPDLLTIDGASIVGSLFVTCERHALSTSSPA